MAIEIAPVKKENSLNENLILIFSIIILLASSGIYFYLSTVSSQKNSELIELNGQFSTLAGSDVKAKEDELTEAGKYISDFKILYENNPKVSGLLTSFSRWTHPKVTYSSFAFDVTARKATMAGTTNGFQNIMQQIAILKKETTIESYQISNVNLAESGLVTFNLDVVLKPEVFK